MAHAPEAPDPRRSTSAIDDLVITFLEQIEAGGAADIDAFCAQHSGSGDDLRTRLLTLRRAGLLEDPSAKAPEVMPERMGEFRLLERLGGGGMGIVYLAEQTSLDRRVALKLIRPEQTYFPGARERFRREVESVAALAHPGIVPVYAFGEANGVPFFAMEHVVGATLGEIVEGLAGRAPETLTGRDLAHELARIAKVEVDANTPLFAETWARATLLLVRQVAEALQHAHERGVLHRDVKPSNVMLSPDGRARLMDFGLAVRAGSDRLTRTGTPVGSLAYMSPEQADGASAATTSWDVYALGVMLYELLTLRLPFFNESTAAMLRRIGQGRPDSPRRLNAAVSTDISTVCAVAMDLDPQRRYASAKLLGDDLTRILERRPIHARPASSALRLQRWAQRSPARAVAVALAAIVAIGGPITYAVVQKSAREQVETINAELTSSNSALERAKGEIEHKNVDLQQTLARAEAQRVRAEGNFDRAFHAVDEMLGDVGAEDLEDEPALQPVRKKLLDKALVFYGQLLADKPGDTDVRREQARIGRAMADVYSSLGDADKAEALYREQIRMLRELRQQAPADVDVRYTLASCEVQLAGKLLATKRAPEARTLLDEARSDLTALCDSPAVQPAFQHDLAVVAEDLALMARSEGRHEDELRLLDEAAALGTKLVQATPDSRDYQGLLATFSSRRAAALDKLGRDDEARVAFRRCFDAQDRLWQAEPHSRRLAKQLVETAANFGLLLGKLGAADEAEHVLVHGRDVAQQFVKDYPADQRAQINLAGICINLGVQVGSHGQPAAAKQAFELARATMQRLVEVAPDVVEHHFWLGTALQNLAGIDLDAGNVDRAMPTIERSLAEFDLALAGAPGHPAILAQKGFTTLSLADALRQQGHHAEAAKKAEEVTAVAGSRADLIANQAEVLATCADAASKDATLSPEQREQAIATYTESAFAALRRALTGHFGDFAYLRSSPKLARLRADPRFESMLTEFASHKQ